MTITRRNFLLTAPVGWLGAHISSAWSATYPTKPGRIVVGFAPGGPMGIVAQVIAQWLTERLYQPFIVEFKPGAGGNLGTEAVARAQPDGYSLLMCGPVNTINTSLYNKLSFNFAEDIVPVASIVRVPLVLVVNPSVPVRTLQDFVKYAKANPARLNMASAGNGTPQHVAGEMFKMMTGVHMLHIPYRGSAPALTDLIGGQVQVMFDAMPSAIEHIKSGKLIPLAVTTAQRTAVLPEVPTVSESVNSYEASSWYGLGAPRGTPSDIVTLLNREVNAALENPKVRNRLESLGGMDLSGSSTDFAKLIADETIKWRGVIRAASIRVD